MYTSRGFSFRNWTAREKVVQYQKIEAMGFLDLKLFGFSSVNVLFQFFHHSHSTYLHLLAFLKRIQNLKNSDSYSHTHRT